MNRIGLGSLVLFTTSTVKFSHDRESNSHIVSEIVENKKIMCTVIGTWSRELIDGEFVKKEFLKDDPTAPDSNRVGYVLLPQGQSFGHLHALWGDVTIGKLVELKN